MSELVEEREKREIEGVTMMNNGQTIILLNLQLNYSKNKKKLFSLNGSLTERSFI